MEFLTNYGLFIAKTATIVVAILIILGVFASILAKSKEKAKEGKLCITKLDESYAEITEVVNEATLDKKTLKLLKKEKKAAEKNKKEETQQRSRLFVVDFIGDIRANDVAKLREEITAILLVAKPQDEVLVRLESPGGMVNAYGLAASQLQRLRDAKVNFTVAVDKVAASGGYMMACVANRIIAAPFAIVGSIGVVAQLPNFHRWLKKNAIDFEMITAGDYKRTLTIFGENTEKGRTKMQEEVDEAHDLFKSFIKERRPKVDLEKIATGEHWFATKALENYLVDELKTSDDFLLHAKNNFDLYLIEYRVKQPLAKRLGIAMSHLMNKFVDAGISS